MITRIDLRGQAKAQLDTGQTSTAFKALSVVNGVLPALPLKIEQHVALMLICLSHRPNVQCH